MITTQTIHTLQLDSLNIQLDTSGNIFGYISKEKLTNDLQSIIANDNGVIKFTCDKRIHPPRNGKRYTHMPPKVEMITTFETDKDKTE